jgi:hypothetical protein
VAPYSKAAYQRALRVYRLVHGAHRPWARRVVATLKALHAPDVDSADECGFCGACPPAVKLGQGHSVYRGQGEVNAWCLLIHAGSLCVSVAFTMYSPFAFSIDFIEPQGARMASIKPTPSTKTVHCTTYGFTHQPSTPHDTMACGALSTI